MLVMEQVKRYILEIMYWAMVYQLKEVLTLAEVSLQLTMMVLLLIVFTLVVMMVFLLLIAFKVMFLLAASMTVISL